MGRAHPGKAQCFRFLSRNLRALTVLPQSLISHQRWGLDLGGRKSAAGTIFMFAVSFALTLCFTLIFNARYGAVLPALEVSTIIAAAATAVELFNAFGIDNLAVPLASAIVYVLEGFMRLACFVAAGGFVGSLLDSLLGATVQAQYAATEGQDPLVLTERRLAPDGRPNRLARGISFVDNDVVSFASCALATLLGVVLAPSLL
jgi:hypothetical protein